MSHRAWVATRKGLFELRRARAGWGISSVAFLGEPVSGVQLAGTALVLAGVFVLSRGGGTPQNARREA